MNITAIRIFLEIVNTTVSLKQPKTYTYRSQQSVTT